MISLMGASEYTGSSLTRDRVVEILDSRGVSRAWYSTEGAQIFDGFVLRHRPDGWAVFYTERGSDSHERVHQTEADACRDVLERILNDRGINKQDRP